MFSKFEMIGAGICVALMALAIFMVQMQTDLARVNDQPASAITSRDVVVVPDSETTNRRAQQAALLDASSLSGGIERMVIDDIKIGTGPTATSGDTVAVHYIGRLQDGTEFDNSRKRGAPITFTIGAGEVIPGWEEGIAGMAVGGERILVIPPEKAYGRNGIGPIPGNATLVFAVELVSLNE